MALNATTERIIHRTLIVYIILSPFAIGLLAFGFYSRGVQLGQVRSELAWKGLELRMIAPIK